LIEAASRLVSSTYTLPPDRLEKAIHLSYWRTALHFGGIAWTILALWLLVRWGFDWGEIVREAMRNGQACASYDPDIVGQAILGAIHQTAAEGARSQRGREEVLDNLTRFLVKALRP